MSDDKTLTDEVAEATLTEVIKERDREHILSELGHVTALLAEERQKNRDLAARFSAVESLKEHALTRAEQAEDEKKVFYEKLLHLSDLRIGRLFDEALREIDGVDADVYVEESFHDDADDHDVLTVKFRGLRLGDDGRVTAARQDWMVEIPFTAVVKVLVENTSEDDAAEKAIGNICLEQFKVYEYDGHQVVIQHVADEAHFTVNKHDPNE